MRPERTVASRELHTAYCPPKINLFTSPKARRLHSTRGVVGGKWRGINMLAFVEAFFLIALIVGGLFAIGSTCTVMLARTISALEGRRLRVRPVMAVSRP